MTSFLLHFCLAMTAFEYNKMDGRNLLYYLSLWWIDFVLWSEFLLRKFMLKIMFSDQYFFTILLLDVFLISLIASTLSILLDEMARKPFSTGLFLFQTRRLNIYFTILRLFSKFFNSDSVEERLIRFVVVEELTVWALNNFNFLNSLLLC